MLFRRCCSAGTAAVPTRNAWGRRARPAMHLSPALQMRARYSTGSGGGCGSRQLPQGCSNQCQSSLSAPGSELRVPPAGRLADEMQGDADGGTRPASLTTAQVARLHQLLHEARFQPPDGAHLSPAGATRSHLGAAWDEWRWAPACCLVGFPTTTRWPAMSATCNALGRAGPPGIADPRTACCAEGAGRGGHRG